MPRRRRRRRNCVLCGNKMFTTYQGKNPMHYGCRKAKEEKDLSIEQKEDTPIPPPIPVKQEKKERDYSLFEMASSISYTLCTNGYDVNIPSHEVCIGQTTISENLVFNELNLTEFFGFSLDNKSCNLWNHRYDAADISGRLQLFLNEGDRLETLINAKYFFTASNPSRGGCSDLPCLNALVFAYLFKSDRSDDIIILNPLDFLNKTNSFRSSKHIQVLNLSAIVQWIQERMSEHRVPFNADTDGFEFVSYQCGDGNVDKDTANAIYSKVPREVPIYGVKLVPGKKGKGKNSHLYNQDEFKKNVATIVASFCDIKQCLESRNLTSLKRIYLVLDRFSGYSLATVAAIYGLGYLPITYLLQYRRGSYTVIKL